MFPLTPSISWTDATGPATLSCVGLTFRNWTPDVVDVGESEVTVGDGVTYFFAYRQDSVASFELSQLANTELALALRLKSWLVTGGTITITTQDALARVYTVRLAPKTIPELTMSDTTALEYTLKLQVVNTVAAPLLYTPVVNARPHAVALSPSPRTLTFPGSPQTVTATVTDATGAALPGASVAATFSALGVCTVVPAVGVSDASGHVVFTLTPHAVGTGTLTVRTGGVGATDAVTVTA